MAAADINSSVWYVRRYTFQRRVSLLKSSYKSTQHPKWQKEERDQSVSPTAPARYVRLSIRARIENYTDDRAPGDPGYQMLRQAKLGPVDFITGDYIAGT